MHAAKRISSFIAAALCLPFSSAINLPPTNRQPAIFGTGDVTDGQFPYVVFLIHLVLRRCYTCTGSLVGENWVLTAAHCVDRQLDPSKIVIAGGKTDLKEYVYSRCKKIPFSEDLDEKKFGLQERRATGVYCHPKHTRSGSHDIGLVRLNNPFVINDRVSVISITNEPFEQRIDCVLVGFGVVEGNLRMYRLRHVRGILAKPAGSCRYQRSKDVICLGETSYGICQGDSGAPLVCGGSIRGVASYGLSKGSNCGRGIVEQYYSDVERNLDWINRIGNFTRKNSPCD